ncbi:MAG: T9SS type A sorting domain-containing protein [Bacteroidetes bacterium]|nr:T9SS type A sorting domain-containing protein [Bacteroidota bacterium]
MKTQLLTLALSSAMSIGMFAQTGRTIQPCNTFAAMEEVFANDPSAKSRYETNQKLLENSYNEAIKNRDNQKTTSAVSYTIPVVFHILHAGGSENVSDQTCINALNWVNLDYARMNTDTASIAQPFKTSYINSNMVFMLAHLDPSGNCTSGIVHHYDPVKTVWNQSQAYTPGYYSYTWDPTRYLNVYVVQAITPSGTLAPGLVIVGYTYLPGTWGTGASQDVVVYNYQFLGQNSPIDARSLSHEIGHWFNLKHTWGSTNSPGVSCGDDGIQDTPITKGEQSFCPASNTSACSQTYAPMNNLNNVQNIMNYASCPRNFTTLQTTAMRNAAVSSVANRVNVSSSGNLTSTGVFNTTVVCAPISFFLSTTNSYTVCSGNSLTFKDMSSNAPVTSWTWTASNGAVVASPNNSVTAINFPNPGTSVITLIAGNASGSSSSTQNITILNGTAQINGTWFESFESTANQGLPTNWQVIGANTPNTNWTQTNMAAYDGFYSFYIEGANNPPTQVSTLQTPMINFAALPGNTLTINYAYARNSASNGDIFTVLVSKDCGGSWQSLASLSASQMQSGSGGISSTPFVPTLSQWKTLTLSNNTPIWNSVKTSSNVLMQFQFTEDPTNGYGNRMFIDALNLINTTAGLKELNAKYQFEVYPNPSNGAVNLKFTLNDGAKVKASIVDVLGKQIISTDETSYNSGEQTITLNQNNSLAKGIYFVNVNINGTVITNKLVIN